MAELKTKQTAASVAKFLSGVKDEQKRKDCMSLVEIMQSITKSEPKMWGTSIIGFGTYHYKYASGHEGDACLLGLSPRKDAITLYLMAGVQAKPDLLKSLGKIKTGKGCLYIKRLEDVDVAVLRRLLRESLKANKQLAVKRSAGEV